MITLSEKAEVISALMIEKKALQEQAVSISNDMDKAHEEFFLAMKRYSEKQNLILAKMIALDESIEKVLQNAS